MKSLIFISSILFSLFYNPASAAPTCQNVDRYGYDVIKSLPGVTYFESDCHFPGKYREHLISNVCFEDSQITHPDGRIQNFRKVTCTGPISVDEKSLKLEASQPIKAFSPQPLTPEQIEAHKKAQIEEASAYQRLQDAIKNTAPSSHGKLKLNPGQVVNDCWQYGTLAQCGHAKGFFDPAWYGAIPNNSGADNGPALLAAETAACTDGNKRVKVQIGGKYNFQSQVNHPCAGLIRFADPQNVMYDAGNPNDAVEFYANTGYFTSANRCVFNDNGYTDQVTGNINEGGDGGQNGYAMHCNSFNYTGSGQIPRHYFFNMGISGTGVAWGCGLNTGIGSPTKLTQPYSGSGSTCGNYMGYRASNVIVEESAQAANGNLTDFDWSGPFSACAGNASGCITGANNGTQGVYVDIPRSEENDNGGFSGVNTTGSPTWEVNGPNWLIKTQWQANAGAAAQFDGSCGADVLEGSYGGDGWANIQGARSEIVLNATCGPGISLSNLVGISGGYGLVAPPDFFENLSGTNTISMIGGNADATQYTTNFILNTSGTLTVSPLLTAGQPVILPNLKVSTVLTAGTTTPSISTSTFATNAALGNFFHVLLVHAACPCTLSNPTNPVDGQVITYEIKRLCIAICG